MRHQLGQDSRSVHRGLLTLLRRVVLGRMGLLRSRDGIAALEFALLAPILIATTAGLYDLTTAFIAWKRVAMSAQAIAEIATSLAATGAGTNILDASRVANATSAVYAYLPSLLSKAPPAFGVTASSIVMVPAVLGCTTGCSYKAHVAWSGVFQGAGTLRPCDTPVGTSPFTYVADATSPSPTTLPKDLKSAAPPVLVVDVNYTYSPLFFTFITGKIQIVQSAYFSPRIGLVTDWTHYYSAGGADTTTLCTNYPASTINPN